MSIVSEEEFGNPNTEFRNNVLPDSIDGPVWEDLPPDSSATNLILKEDIPHNYIFSYHYAGGYHYVGGLNTINRASIAVSQNRLDWTATQVIGSPGYSINFIDDNPTTGTVIAVTSNYTDVYRTTDNGQTWDAISTPVRFNTSNLKYIPYLDVWFMCSSSNNEYFYSDDDGLTWNSISISSSAGSKIAFNDNTTVLIGIQSFFCTDDITSWSTSNPTITGRSDIVYTNDMFVVSDDKGKLEYSTTGINGSWLTTIFWQGVGQPITQAQTIFYFPITSRWYINDAIGSKGSTEKPKWLISNTPDVDSGYTELDITDPIFGPVWDADVNVINIKIYTDFQWAYITNTYDYVLNSEIVGIPSIQLVVKYHQNVMFETINTNDDRFNFYDIRIAQDNFIKIPDVNAIEDYRSSYVGVGLRILEIIALAGQYIGAYITPPTERPDQGSGTSPLQDGDMIYDRFYKTLRIWNESSWENYVFQSFPDYFRTGLTPTRIDDDTFTIPYDMTTIYSESKRLRFEDDTGDTVLYGTIVDSSHSVGTTTVNVTMDSGVIPDPLRWVDISNVPAPGWIQVVSQSAADLTAIATGSIGVDELYFAGGANGTILKSSDGSTWTDLTGTITNLDENVLQIVYHEFRQAFYIRTSNWVFVTTDGINWTSRGNNDAMFPTYDLEFGGYITASPTTNTVWFESSSSSNLIKTDDDLTTAEVYSASYAADGGLSSSDYNGYYIGFSNDITNATLRVASNPGFTSASEVVSGAVTKIEYMYSNGFVVFCYNGVMYRGTSATADTTSVVGDSSFGLSNINDGIWNNNFNLWVAVGDNGKIATSHDYGTTWVQRPNPFLITDKIMGVCYNEDDNLFVAVGDGGKIAISTNGITAS